MNRSNPSPRILVLILVVLPVLSVVPVRAAGDFLLTADIPPVADTAHQSVSTITVTSVYGFSGTVALSDTHSSGLSCSPINPSSVSLDTYTPSVGATLSCSASTPGLYNVTVTGTSPSLSHTARYTANITAAPPTTNTPQPATILGLSPAIICALVGVIVVGVAAGYFGLRRRRLPGKKSA
ncbi:MAG TPA: hypothetical protein VGS11_00840 [Candidatus Bathyarchaeia archaeon]|nr:hypothetical protein [Candidatus Bathyarchaeia archaeon]